MVGGGGWWGVVVGGRRVIAVVTGLDKSDGVVGINGV